MLVDEVKAKAFLARRHRRMHGEYAARRRHGFGLLKCQPVIAHIVAHALQEQKGGVPLIHVKDVNMDAQRAQKPHAADAD